MDILHNAFSVRETIACLPTENRGALNYKRPRHTRTLCTSLRLRLVVPSAMLPCINVHRLPAIYIALQKHKHARDKKQTQMPVPKLCKHCTCALFLEGLANCLRDNTELNLLYDKNCVPSEGKSVVAKEYHEGGSQAKKHLLEITISQLEQHQTVALRCCSWWLFLPPATVTKHQRQCH